MGKGVAVIPFELGPAVGYQTLQNFRDRTAGLGSPGIGLMDYDDERVPRMGMSGFAVEGWEDAKGMSGGQRLSDSPLSPGLRSSLGSTCEIF